MGSFTGFMRRFCSVAVLCLAPLFCLQCGDETGETTDLCSGRFLQGSETDNTHGTSTRESDDNAGDADDENSPSVSFIAFGDWGDGSDHQRDVAEAIGQYCLTETCEFILTLGDNFYNVGVSSIHDLQWKEKYRDIYGSLGIPFYAVLGNHDNYGNAQAQIDYSGIDSSWHMPAKNYTFCWPEGQEPCLVEFFVLNFESFDQNWLINALNESDARWKILALHHFLYSNAVNSTKAYSDDPLGHNNLLLPVICDRIDLILTGHLHAFSHLQTNEDGCWINQIILGIGGHSELHPTCTNDPRVFATADLYGFGWFEVSEKNINFRVVQTDGEVFYTTSMGKSFVDIPVACTKHVIQDLSGAEMITLFDYDDDGWDDLAYTSWHLGELWVARNNHDGTFTPLPIDDGLTFARDVTTGHVNQGNPDCLLVSAFEKGHIVYCRDPLSGLWSKSIVVEVTWGAAGIASADFDLDGEEDLVTCTEEFRGDNGIVQYWRNMGSQTFQEQITLEGFSSPSAVATWDIDNDGVKDVVVGYNGGVAWYHSEESWESPKGPYAIATDLPDVTSVRLHDVNRDGLMDVLITCSTGPMGLYLVYGTLSAPGSVAFSAPVLIDGTLLEPHNVEAADLNNDGQVDLISGSLQVGKPVRIYWQQPTGEFVKETLGTSGVRGVAVLDVLHNGNPSVVISSYTGSEVAWWEMSSCDGF